MVVGICHIFAQISNTGMRKNVFRGALIAGVLLTGIGCNKPKPIANNVSEKGKQLKMILVPSETNTDHWLNGVTSAFDAYTDDLVDVLVNGYPRKEFYNRDVENGQIILTPVKQCKRIRIGYSISSPPTNHTDYSVYIYANDTLKKTGLIHADTGDLKTGYVDFKVDE
ncbi:hypothetical protein D3C72_1150620 [compost metagenome]